MSTPVEDTENNPLLKEFHFPPYDSIKASHVRPGIRALLRQLECELEELERIVEPTWSKLVEPLVRIEDRLYDVSTAVFHLNYVKHHIELLDALNEVLPEILACKLRLKQSKPIYNAFKAIKESPDWDTLIDARKRIIESKIKDTVLKGINLEDDKREQFNKIEQELAKLFQKFYENASIMTKKYESLVSVEQDAVELPSQFMENWCYHRDTFMSIGKHYITGESIPEEIYKKLLAARTFRAGSCTLDHIKVMVDLELDTRYVPGSSESIHDVYRKVCKRMHVLHPLPEDKFLCYFKSIFSGGYAAGCFSYKWAEVMSADAFSAFEEAGLDDDEELKEMGSRFRETILAHGGGKAAIEVFVEFRGREPSLEALLLSDGLLHVAAST